MGGASRTGEGSAPNRSSAAVSAAADWRKKDAETLRAVFSRYQWIQLLNDFISSSCDLKFITFVV